MCSRAHRAIKARIMRSGNGCSIGAVTHRDLARFVEMLEQTVMACSRAWVGLPPGP
jgi:hypothetical protein